MPAYVALVVEPVVGLLADRGHRRSLILGGGVLFVATTLALGLVPGFVVLLIVAVVASPASGAFVGLSQAALMEGSPGQLEQAMARWTLIGSVGVVAAPLLVAASVAAGAGWRAVFAGLGATGIALLLTGRRLPANAAAAGEQLSATVRATLQLLRRREVVRWLVLLQAADLMLDVLHGFLALYLVDVTHASPTAAALAVAVWTGAGLVGDAALVVVLRRIPGLRYLRWSALLVALLYPAFLLVPGLPAKLIPLAGLGLLNAGWYALPQAQLYEAVGRRTGAVLTLGTVAGAGGSTLPLAIGLVAGATGLGAALWIPLAAPLVLLTALPRAARPRG